MPSALSHSPDVSTPTRRHTALVVEDDPATQRLIAHTLRGAGLSPVGVGSGEAALAWLEMNPPPALMSVDLMLPHMSGLRLCDAVRTRHETASLPIVIITARSGVQDEAAALEVGAAFLGKPFRVRELIDLVTGLLAPR